MMMVQALRPKITRNSGYISTIGAEAMAATQVSQRLLQQLEAVQQHAAGDAEHREHDAGGEAFGEGEQEAAEHVLLDDHALELARISEGGGTMKRLRTPIWISTSIDQKERHKRCRSRRPPARRHRPRTLCRRGGGHDDAPS